MSSLRSFFLYAENAVLNRGDLKHGMQVVTKPVDKTELTRRVQTILSGD